MLVTMVVTTLGMRRRWMALRHSSTCLYMVRLRPKTAGVAPMLYTASCSITSSSKITARPIATTLSGSYMST